MSSVENVVRLLNLFIDEPELGVREMSRRLDLGKSTVHRIASELAEADLLAKDAETSRYRLGLRLLELGSLVQARGELSNAAEPVLRSLLRTGGETVHLAVREGLEIVYIAKMESNHSIRMYSRLGRRGPAHCTGIGKAMLAFHSDDWLTDVLAAGLARQTPATITDPAVLRRQLEEVRRLGYAFDDEEIEVGLRCVAAPVRDHTGAVIAGISVSGPSQRMTREKMRALVAPVIAGAEQISRHLGWRGDTPTGRGRARL